MEDALDHPYLEVSFGDSLNVPIAEQQPYHDPTDEPTAKPLRPEFFEFVTQDDERGREFLKRERAKRVSTDI